MQSGIATEVAGLKLQSNSMVQIWFSYCSMSQTALEQIQLLNHSSIPAPSHFSASHPSPRGILLTWEPNPLPSPSPHQYLLFLWLLNASLYTNHSVYNDTLSYQVQLLEPYTHYQAALTALTHEGNYTQFTSALSFRTNESTPIFYPRLTIESVSSNSLYLTWSTLPLSHWRGAPYQYKLSWYKSGTTERQDKFLAYNYTYYELTGLQTGVEYSIRISALTEFGGEGPLSPPRSATPTAPYPLSSPLQYIAVPVIVVLAVCTAYTTWVLKGLLCRFQGLSASWFKRQKKHYQLLTPSDVKVTKNTNARQSPLLLRNTKVPSYTPQSAHRASEYLPPSYSLDSPPKARSAVTLQSDGSYSQLPTPIRPVSALNISTHTNSYRTSTASSVREARSDKTSLPPVSVHRLTSSSAATDRGQHSILP